MPYHARCSDLTVDYRNVSFVIRWQVNAGFGEQIQQAFGKIVPDDADPDAVGATKC